MCVCSSPGVPSRRSLRLCSGHKSLQSRPSCRGLAVHSPSPPPHGLEEESEGGGGGGGGENDNVISGRQSRKCSKELLQCATYVTEKMDLETPGIYGKNQNQLKRIWYEGFF